jgi:hypothetical protein
VTSMTGNQWPASLDAMVAAPSHHEVLLENEHVRVLDTKLGPGESTPVHTHPWPSVLYVLSWSAFVRYDLEGLAFRSREGNNPLGGASRAALRPECRHRRTAGHCRRTEDREDGLSVCDSAAPTRQSLTAARAADTRCCGGA